MNNFLEAQEKFTQLNDIAKFYEQQLLIILADS